MNPIYDDSDLIEEILMQMRNFNHRSEITFELYRLLTRKLESFEGCGNGEDIEFIEKMIKAMRVN
ncbi:hypothetical protein [Alkalihalophilus marmarensis]|uniref:hypothetical protein n=1 Tax=Alkalihalophilus marmarensis TaxID=521377 RepID=UPI002E1CF104|nr:hypothetical protein [Alkalihalophilus marmarensis]